MSNKYCYQTDIGNLCVEDNGKAITGLYIVDSLESHQEKESILTRDTYKQIQEYLAHKRKKFNLPIELHGTQFQNEVWSSICDIPYGEIRSYGDVAKDIGNPKSVRAVGQALNKNPIMIIIPCHRIIGANGNLVGFGAGLKIKSILLEIEKRGR